MSDDLEAALQGVAAERSVRDQMRTDWGQFKPREEVLYEAVIDLRAERDALRMIVEAVRAWRDSKMRIIETDESDLDRADQIETARQAMWLALARWEEGFD